MAKIALVALVAVLLLAGCDSQALVTEDETELLTSSQSVRNGSRQSCGCQMIKGIINVTLDPESLTTEGVSRGGIKGKVGLVVDPASIVPIVSEQFPPVVAETWSFLAEALFTTKKGDLTMRVGGINEGIPGGVSAQIGKIIGGTGIYEGSTGTFFFSAQNDEETGLNVELNMQGEICYAEKRRKCD